MSDVFKKHGQRIAKQDANIPKPILDVLYPQSPRKSPPLGTCTRCQAPIQNDGTCSAFCEPP